jgi:hypothetical protein
LVATFDAHGRKIGRSLMFFLVDSEMRVSKRSNYRV